MLAKRPDEAKSWAHTLDELKCDSIAFCWAVRGRHDAAAPGRIRPLILRLTDTVAVQPGSVNAGFFSSGKNRVWARLFPSESVVNVGDYLDHRGQRRNTQVINLCRNYDYQGLGYYCTCSPGHGHRILPTLRTINGRSPTRGNHSRCSMAWMGWTRPLPVTRKTR